MVDEAQRHRSGYGGVDLRDPNPGNNPLEGFHMMSGRTDQFVQERNGETVNDSTRDFWTASNPKTGTRYTTTKVNTPTSSYERRVDPSGFGQERYNGGDFTDFWMKGGGQDYMPARGIMQMANTNNPESNFRILQQMSPTQQEEYQTADASNVFDTYNQYKDKYGEFDFGDMEYSNSYEKELGPGILGFDGSYDFDDNDAKMGINYSMSFDDGGIATLPETQSMQQPKVPMTDEQKDYLYDYMLDFMMKQRMKEQKEMEGKIPPFNYEGLEV